MAKFKFDLEDKVVFEDAVEVKATVIGRAEYVEDGNKYLLRYMDGTGSPCECWWSEDAIMEDEDNENNNDRDERDRDRD